MDTLYKMRVRFPNGNSGFLEEKDFVFTSKDSEVDFYASMLGSADVDIVSRIEVRAYGRGDFIVALNDFEIARNRGLE